MATETLRPDSAGDQTNIPTQFPGSGSHWDKVDEASADDGTTYVASATSSTPQNDLYNLPSLPGGIGTITDVTVWARCKASVSGFPLLNFAILMKTGGSTFLSSAQTITDSWANFSKVWDENPDTSAAWTISDINALQIGVRLNGSTAPPTVFTLCTQVYVVITHGNAPTVTTGAIQSTGTTTAIVIGNVTDLGTDNPTAYGHAYNTTGQPVTGDNNVDLGAKSTTGRYHSYITDLIPGTQYFFRAYATNSFGTSYGAEVQTTPDTYYLYIVDKHLKYQDRDKTIRTAVAADLIQTYEGEICTYRGEVQYY